MSWYRFLQREMAKANNATYQTCIHLQMLLAQKEQGQKQVILNTLQSKLFIKNNEQLVALTTINAIYLSNHPALFDLLDLESPLNLHFLEHLQNIWDIRAIRDLGLSFYSSDLRYLQDLLPLLGTILEQDQGQLRSLVLLTLHSALQAKQNLPEAIIQAIQETLHRLKQQTLTKKQRLLLTPVEQSMPQTQSVGPFVPISLPPLEARIERLAQLEQQARSNNQNLHLLEHSDIEELLAASLDGREIPEEQWKALTQEENVWGKRTLAHYAWRLLSTPFPLSSSALQLILRALGGTNPVICAGAALLLQHGKNISQQMCEEACQKISELLEHDTFSHRPLDPPALSSQVWRLDDVLFETLRVLAE